MTDLITTVAAVIALATGLSGAAERHAELDRMQQREVVRLTAVAEVPAPAPPDPEPEVEPHHHHPQPVDSVWDRLAACESNGDWHINTGNGYFGGLQFNLQTWRAYGGTGHPHEHPRTVQIEVAERLRAARGFQPWPACSIKLGLR